MTNPKHKTPAGPVMPLVLFILAVLTIVTLTGLAWNNSALPLQVQNPSLTPTLSATPSAQHWLTSILRPPADPASQTNGIIIAGGAIVLIILGGTYGATRRKH
jgi:hypothetical protein